MNIKPIKSEQDYQEALNEIEQLMDAEPNTPECDKLDILATLVDIYETEHYPIDDPDPIELIIHRMEALELTEDDLIPIFGSYDAVLEILQKKRPLTLTLIRNLHEKLNLPADVLIKPYELNEKHQII